MKPLRSSTQDTRTQLNAFEALEQVGEGAYRNVSATDAERTRARDQVIFNEILADDLIFETFAWDTWGADVGVATVSDWAVLGLTAAGSLITGGASQVLSATATAVTGAKTSLQKNALYSKTLDQLIVAITISRTQFRAHILACMAYPDSQYSLGAAKIDLEQYKQAAMLPLAVANLSTTGNSALSQPNCFTATDIGPIAHDPTVKLISDWVEPDGIHNAARETTLENWMAASRNPALTHAPWSQILLSAYTADRIRALSDLKIL